ncbi:MAG: class I SAM-dependent methyltransferase [Acidobacteriota bacterium]|nr:class I SAM-dependent methyltransferase [Acidobacteriota bacterium]
MDPNDPGVQKVLREFPAADLPASSGIKIDAGRMVSLLRELAVNYQRLPFSNTAQPGLNYYYENPAFPCGDAIILGLMLLHYKPRKVIEVGSGFSSCVMIDLNGEAYRTNPADLTFVEPFPETLLSLLAAGSPYRNKILAERVQSVPLDDFGKLGENDILFIDSTHVSKMGSDVNYLIFNVLPILKPGVLIHIHDVFYPFEYPSEWIVNENRSWNEAYLLRSFLQFNSAFKVIFWNHFAQRKFPAELEALAPLFMKSNNGSIWLRRR